MRIAHFSDIHLLGEGKVPLRRFLNKRITGWVNLKFRRHAVHKPSVAEKLAELVHEQNIDHVVVTGDFTNLALEKEFSAARDFIDMLKFPVEQISLVPGNHDLYTSGSARAKRFANTFAPYLGSDLPEYATDHPAGPFPYVHLRGPVAFIGVSTAVPRPMLLASGVVGRPQLDSLEKILSLPQVRSRLPIILQHHPPFNERLLRTFAKGLWDARDLRAVLARAPHTVVLHGHLHVRVLKKIREGNSLIESIGATSASLVDTHEHKGAGFNLYEIDDQGGWAAARACVIDTVDGKVSVTEGFAA